MTAPRQSTAARPPIDLAKWRRLPDVLIIVGAALVALGLVVSGRGDGFRQFGFAWLLAFTFFLSLSLGSLFLVLMHHLFDAGWSVPLRRFNEHLACLSFPWLAVFFVPIALLAPRIYDQTSPLSRPAGFYLSSAACLAVWAVLARNLRRWSLRQDATGAALCTFKLRAWSAGGIFAYAVALTLGAVVWMQALTAEWFSTMYGVWFFAASVWFALATAYAITLLLDRQGLIRAVLHEHQYYFLGSLFFAFTVFHAYVAFMQYFIVWNANLPAQTSWYVLRERGTWFYVGLALIFGHFFVPFLALLRIEAKSTFPLMIALVAWAWLMHYADLAWNLKPAAAPDGFPFRWVWLDFGCLALMGGVLAKVFLRDFAAHAPFPIKDPRLGEAMGLRSPVPAQISGGESDESDER